MSGRAILVTSFGAAGSAASQALNEPSIEEMNGLVQTIPAERAEAATIVEPADSQDVGSILD